MFGLGMPELLVILVLVLLVFGASRLPEIGSGLGKAIRGFKKGVQEPTEINPTAVKPDPDHPGKKSA
ncbi:MAG: twin-arginine translocase TatA/TatE family subunit [Nitrospiria bacterium]